MNRNSEIQAALDWSRSRKIDKCQRSIGDALADGYLELEAINAELLEALKNVKQVIEDSEQWWMDCPDRGGFDLRAIENLIARLS